MSVRGFHPACLALPAPTEIEVERMAASLRAAGLVDPVVMTPAGLVVDGRLRALAAARAGVALRFEVRDLSPLEAARLVAARHCAGRLLTPSQRAMVASRLAAAVGLSKDAAAELLGVSDTLVRGARRIDNASREAGDRVLAGDATVSALVRRPAPASEAPAPPAPRRTGPSPDEMERTLRLLVSIEASTQDVRERSVALRTLARRAREVLGE